MGIEELRGLNILIVSPNEWGDMRVSKHHYATALAQRGNRVVFLNPPNSQAPERLQLKDVAGIASLTTVTYRPFVPYSLRFHARHLYNLVAGAHVRWLLSRIGVRFDVVWCFDVNLYSDLRWFGAPLKIFHPVDQVSLPYQTEVAEHADVVLSVSEQILRNLREHHSRQLRVEHGLAQEFVELAERRMTAGAYTKNDPLRVGYVGNLLMRYLDRDVLQSVVASHPELEFHFWGPRTASESNVGSDDAPDAERFVMSLASMPNVTLHGPQRANALAGQIGDVDLLVMCYSVSRDPNHGCNSHKILEYLSTGRVVVSNHVSDYADKPELLEMMTPDGGGTFSELFGEVTRRITEHNDETRQRRRLTYALDNSYPKQIDRIASFIASRIADREPQVQACP